LMSEGGRGSTQAPPINTESS